MVSEQFDRCHGTLLQYVEFLCSAVTPASNYAILVPSLNDLVHLYHLDPEVFVCFLPLFYYELLHFIMTIAALFYHFFSPFNCSISGTSYFA